ncbi:hypothetical protein COCNU_scaffold002521G000010 [Cocos nucifera]|nr:hypothetical protein [Cocos nucifera]
MGFMFRVRLSSFFAGATTASIVGFYLLYKDYMVAHEAISRQLVLEVIRMGLLSQPPQGSFNLIPSYDIGRASCIEEGMLYDSSLQKVEKESKAKQQKQLITSLIRTGHYAAVVINQIMDAEEEMAVLQKAEVTYLKKALEEAKVSKLKVEASLKKKWQKARSKATDLEKKMEDRVAEARKEAVVAFKASKEYSREKINFGQKAYIAGRDICHQRMAAHFPELNLSFWIENMMESEEIRLVIKSDEKFKYHLLKRCPLKNFPSLL